MKFGSLERNRLQGRRFPTVLQYMQVPVISNPECRKINKTLQPDQFCTRPPGLWYKTIIKSQTKCLFVDASLLFSLFILLKSVAGKGACSGDFGNPLINERRELIGIFMSVTKPCGVQPNAFTRVFAHLEWIQRVSGVRPNQRPSA